MALLTVTCACCSCHSIREASLHHSLLMSKSLPTGAVLLVSFVPGLWIVAHSEGLQ